MLSGPPFFVQQYGLAVLPVIGCVACDPHHRKLVVDGSLQNLE